MNNRLISIYGVSTGRAPTQVKIKKTQTKHQNKIWLKGLEAFERNLFLCKKGRVNKTPIEAAKATVPPNLLGIDRRIA